MTTLPLEGIRVADFTWVIAGPSMTRNLALLGAEVIRIESEKRAEYRARGGSFALLNDNKKSCALDLSQAEAREIACRIIGQSDIVVENFGAGVMGRLGLDYDSVRSFKPDIIMLSCSGMGRTGPDSDKLAFGTLLQLFSGWSLIQGHRDTTSIHVGGAWTDPLTALHGTFAMLSALYHRQQTGEGQYIDLSMVEATMCGLPESLMDFSMNRRLPSRYGNSDPVLAPHSVYRCSGDDNWVAISVTNENQWLGLKQAIGSPDWADTPEFADMYRRKSNEEVLNRHLTDWTSSRDPLTVTRVLQAAGVPAGPSLGIVDLVNDEHLRDRGMFVNTRAPQGDDRITIGANWKITPGVQPSYRPAPRLGQDSEYVLEEIAGLDHERAVELIERKVAY
jgi:benzylsuccinate CoA-transferase BbsF subunit